MADEISPTTKPGLSIFDEPPAEAVHNAGSATEGGTGTVATTTTNKTVIPPVTETTPATVSTTVTSIEGTAAKVDAPAISSDVIAESLRKAFPDLGKPKVEELPAKKIYTPEEAKKLLKVWEPSPEFLTKLGNLETQGAALAEMRDGLMAQFDTIGQVRLQQAIDQIKAQYEPAVKFAQTYQQEQVRQTHETAFYSKFPGLQDKNFEPIITAVVAGLTQAGTKFNSVEDSYKAIADGVTGIIKAAKPDFDPTKPRETVAADTTSATATTSTGSTPVVVKHSSVNPPNALSSQSTGAGGGGAKKGGDAEPKKGLAIFDPVT